MKLFKEREQARKDSYYQPNKKTVHRSSFNVAEMPGTEVYFSFLNHFLIKRNFNSISLKVVAIAANGNMVDSLTLPINEPRVYYFNLSKMFKKKNIKNYIVEFFSDKNLVIPFTAATINHFGKDFCNTVHAYNRVLNDVFEDDEINKYKVSEASIDLKINKNFDTFINFSTGPIEVNDKLRINYYKKNYKLKKTVNVLQTRLSNKIYYLSKILKKNIDGGIIKIDQPKQFCFYGRLFAGIINKKTKAFSANHSYYDNSKIKEYFNNNESLRLYPYFKGLKNKITMYPILSPSKINLIIEFFKDGKSIQSKKFLIKSPSTNYVDIDIDDLVKQNNLKNVSAFQVRAKSIKGKIPTRVNHQLIYGSTIKKNSLYGSINSSLTNEEIIIPKNKKGFAWGQFLIGKSYKSYVGFCFKTSKGVEDKVNIKFYDEKGCFKKISTKLNPKEAFIVNSSEVAKTNDKIKFVWFEARSNNPTLTAHSIHYNKNSGNASAEHSFH